MRKSVGRKRQCSAAPVDAGAADALARQERADPADRQRDLGALVAERDGVDRVVLHQFEPAHVAQLVAQRGEAELLLRVAVLAALQPDHGEPGLGELARHDGAGPPHADHDGVDFLELALPSSPPVQEKSAIERGGAT